MLGCGWSLRFGGICVGKVRIGQWPESGASALESLSGPRFSARTQSLVTLFRTSLPLSHSQATSKGPWKGGLSLVSLKKYIKKYISIYY